MRVLYINHTGLMSGAEHSLVGLWQALPQGTTPTLASPPGPLQNAAREMGIRILTAPPLSAGLRLHPTRTAQAMAQLAWASAWLRHLTGTGRWDVIHANSVRAGLVAVAAHLDTPVAVHVRDCLPRTPVGMGVRRVLRGSEAIIANSQYTAHNFGGGERLHVVPNAVDLRRFDPALMSQADARRNLGLERDAQYLAVVAQITPWKGQIDAVLAMPEILKRHPDCHLLIAGEAKFTDAGGSHDTRAYWDLLHHTCQALGITDSVQFLGEVRDVPRLLRAVDILLAPSWEEPFGRTIIEAMAMTTAVIATTVGGPAEIIDDGNTGQLVAPREPVLWAAAITDLLDHLERRTSLGLRGRDVVVRRYGIAEHARRISSIYSQLAAAPRRAPRPESSR